MNTEGMRFMRVDEVAAILNISKSLAYYLMRIGDSDTGISVYLYVYDGTTFLEISKLSGNMDWGRYYGGTITENGVTREIGKEEFNDIYDNWENKHTDFGANTHLDIENIENTFQVKIDVQSSGEWLVTSAE